MWRDSIGQCEATRKATWILATTGQSEWDQMWLASPSSARPFSFLHPSFFMELTTRGGRRRGRGHGKRGAGALGWGLATTMP
jgi:hypothetical protein